MNTAYERVRIARSNDRPTGQDFLQALCPNFVELHGDRLFGDDAAIIGGIGTVCGQAATIIAIEKGHTGKERTRRSFGSPHPEGYRKALRLMRQAEKFGRPVLCLVDTAGAYCGVDAEERGQGAAIAENLMGMMQLSVPILTILIGEGGSGGALALAVADQVWMLENAVYSVISAEGCASILWKDAKKASEAAESLQLTSEAAKRFGIVEEVISEQGLGTPDFYETLQKRIVAAWEELKKDPQLLEHRYERFRKYGR